MANRTVPKLDKSQPPPESPANRATLESRLSDDERAREGEYPHGGERPPAHEEDLSPSVSGDISRSAA
jgi:hypothetical protein